MSDTKRTTGSASAATAILAVAAVVAVLAANKLYLVPRYGGIAAYFIGGKAAGSFAGQTAGNRDSLAAALSIYYSDTDGKYPPSLDALKERNYLPTPMPREDVFIDVGGGKFERAHWHRDSAKVKLFSSRAAADDSGGWGYVADPASPEWGTVFVNCTHLNFKKGVPWNVSAEPAPLPANAQTPSDAAQRPDSGVSPEPATGTGSL